MFVQGEIKNNFDLVLVVYTSLHLHKQWFWFGSRCGTAEGGDGVANGSHHCQWRHFKGRARQTGNGNVANLSRGTYFFIWLCPSMTSYPLGKVKVANWSFQWNVIWTDLERYNLV